MSVLNVAADNLRFVLNNADKWITGVLAGALAKKIILAIIAIFMLSLQVPAISMLFYSIRSGIPAFEAYAAIRDKLEIFVSASIVVTLFVSGFFIVPGVVWFSDPALKGLVWSDQSISDYLHRWTVRRWMVVFVPGIMGALALASLSHYFGVNDGHASFYGFLFGTLCGALIAVALYLAVTFANRRFSKRSGISIPKLDYNVHKLNLHVFLASFVLSFACIIVTFQVIAVEIREGKLSWSKESEYGFWSASILSLFLFFVCFVLMFIGSIWANRRSYVWMLVFLLIHFFILTSAWPGATTLLHGYMRAVRLGGNAPIVLTANRSMAFDWPEMFELGGQVRQEEGLVRSKILLLVLAGNEKLFVRLPRSGEKSLSGVLVMNRSDVHHIMYMDSE